jgi:hypothetical protein
MNKYNVFKKIWFLSLLLVAFMAGCASNGGDPGSLVTLRVTPASYSIPVTGTVQYSVLAVYGDGSSRDVTTAANWSAGTAGVTFGTIKGLATGITASAVPVLITATYNGASGTAALTVNAATSKGLKLSPATASIPVTGNQQYTLLEIFSDGTSQLRTTDLATTWNLTNNTGNISLTPSGLTAGLAKGLIATPAGTPVTITAAYGGKSATATLAVNAATSMGLKLSPTTASIPVTGNQQYTLLEIFSDGTSQPRTTDLSTIWNVTGNNNNISLSPSGLNAGLAVGLKATPAGLPVTITAAYGGRSATATIIVNAATSKGLTLSPLNASIPVTGNQQYTLLEIFSDGTSQFRTEDLNTTWNVTDNNNNASLSPSGLGAGLAVGLKATPAGLPVTISAAYGGKSATAKLTVNAATSKGLTLSPAVATIPVTGNQQYTLLEIFSDGTSQARTEDLNTIWSTLNNSNNNVSLSPSGLGAGRAVGLKATLAGQPVIIRATYNNTTATAELTVNAATSTSFKVTPLNATIAINGGGQQFAALETFSDGSTIDRTLDSTWSSVNLPLGGLTVSSIGLNTGNATGLAMGQSTITATYISGGITQSGSAILTVTAPNPGIGGPGVDLGTAGSYGLIASDAMTITAVPTTHIFGDVALINNDTFVGFALTGPINDKKSIYVTGQINSKTFGNPAATIQAQADLNSAYMDLSTRVATTIFPSVAATELSGMILEPGIYSVNTPTSQTLALSGINGPLVLDAKGNPDALFIFKTFAMTTTTGSVVLQNGANPKNVFWLVTSDATIGNGTGSFFQGTVVAGNTITVGLNTSVQGRMLAGALGAGAITNHGVITVPK